MTTLNGLPVAPASQLVMLPANTLADREASVWGAGQFAEAAARGLRAVGAHTTHVAQIPSPSQFDDVAADSHPEIVVVCVSPGSPRPAESLDSAALRTIVGDSFESVYAAAAAFARGRGDRGGSLIIVTGLTAATGGPGVAAASAAQAALLHLAGSLATEWAPRDLRVNVVVTGQFTGAPQADPATLPGMRLGEFREFEWLVSYLASDFSAYITGARFIVDGGDSLRRSLLGQPYRANEFLDVD